MKTTSIFALILLIALSVASASAQIDPDPDGVGIYFDEAATIVQTTSGTNVPTGVTAYLVATRSTHAGGLTGMAGRIGIDEDGVFYASIDGVPRLGANTALTMPVSPWWDVRVVRDPALPPFVVGSAAVLADLDVGIYDASIPVHLYVSALELEYEDGTVTPTPASGAAELPVAVINGPAPVAAARVSWGQVKGLFR